MSDAGTEPEPPAGSIEHYDAKRLQDQIDYFERAATREQKRGKLWQNCLIGAAAATPLLIGLAELVHEADLASVLRGLALVSSFLAAVATSLLSTRRYWENGILYRGREQALRHEKFLWQQKAGPYTPPPAPDGSRPGEDETTRRNRLLVERTEAVISEDVGDWTTRMKEAARQHRNE